MKKLTSWMTTEFRSFGSAFTAAVSMAKRDFRNASIALSEDVVQLVQDIGGSFRAEWKLLRSRVSHFRSKSSDGKSNVS